LVAFVGVGVVKQKQKQKKQNTKNTNQINSTRQFLRFYICASVLVKQTQKVTVKKSMCKNRYKVTAKSTEYQISSLLFLCLCMCGADIKVMVTKSKNRNKVKAKSTIRANFFSSISVLRCVKSNSKSKDKGNSKNKHQSKNQN
jgi:hypothetical protein